MNKLTKEILICETCNNEFHTRKSRENTSRFCSPRCWYDTLFGNKLTQGYKHKKSTINKYKLDRKGIANIGSKNGQWKGKKAGYSALHAWVKRHLNPTKLCQLCNKVPPYDLANISQEYKRDLKDWEWLCRKCHMKKDGRLTNFIKLNKRKLIWKPN